jgi:hypothetical protein
VEAGSGCNVGNDTEHIQNKQIANTPTPQSGFEPGTSMYICTKHQQKMSVTEMHDTRTKQTLDHTTFDTEKGQRHHV